MKISICGKGGSGKSVLTALLAVGLKARGYRVLVVDSDESNSGLFRLLGFNRPPIPLMEMVGGKKGLKERMAVKTSAKEAESKGEILNQDRIGLNEIPHQYRMESDNLLLVSIGKILQSLEGCACPMGVLSREFLKKVHLGTNEAALIDMEAGVEHFGRGIETSVDGVMVIVEPSLESLELAARVKTLADEAGVKKTWTVLNKIPSEDLALTLKEELGKREMKAIGQVSYDPEIFRACLEGRRLHAGMAAKEIGEVIDQLIAS
jgi:CO dehydrogenase maturation factor